MEKIGEFFSAYWWILLIAAFVIANIVILLVWKFYKKKEPKKVVNKTELLSSFGGEDNVLSSSLIGSRIVLKLKDNSKIDKEKLLSVGVDSFIEMSDKMTLVVKSDAEKVYKTIFGETHEA